MFGILRFDDDYAGMDGRMVVGIMMHITASLEEGCSLRSKGPHHPRKIYETKKGRGEDKESKLLTLKSKTPFARKGENNEGTPKKEKDFFPLLSKW